MLKEAAPRQEFFEPEQYEALSAALPDYLRLPLALGFNTGMRLGEVLKLRWPQVDFLEGIIRLAGSDTKNGTVRDIPLSRELRGALEAQYSRREDGARDRPNHRRADFRQAADRSQESSTEGEAGL